MRGPACLWVKSICTLQVAVPLRAWEGGEGEWAGRGFGKGDAGVREGSVARGREGGSRGQARECKGGGKGKGVWVRGQAMGYKRIEVGERRGGGPCHLGKAGWGANAPRRLARGQVDKRGNKRGGGRGVR